MLEITDVRIEQVQSITEEDATKELFLSNLELIFTEEVRNELEEMDFNQLAVMGDDTWTIVTLLIMLETEMGQQQVVILLHYQILTDLVLVI